LNRLSHSVFSNPGQPRQLRAALSFLPRAYVCFAAKPLHRIWTAMACCQVAPLSRAATASWPSRRPARQPLPRVRVQGALAKTQSAPPTRAGARNARHGKPTELRAAPSTPPLGPLILSLTSCFCLLTDVRQEESTGCARSVLPSRIRSAEVSQARVKVYIHVTFY
jgi:hypothetical protein